MMLSPGLWLLLELRTADAAVQLWLGRANFAAMEFAAYVAFRFVQEVPAETSARGATVNLQAETRVLGMVTLLTPVVDQAERVTAGRAITTFGPLFPVSVIHVLGYHDVARGPGVATGRKPARARTGGPHRRRHARGRRGGRHHQSRAALRLRGLSLL